MSANQNYKIIITGPVGAGKTTAIGALSDIPPVSTEARPKDKVALLKPTTTVALDYGTMDLDTNVRIHLYGTPGQSRFDFMWDIMADGALGIILLLNNASSDPMADLQQFLSVFSGFLETAAFCVGVTHMDKKATPTLDDYREELAKVTAAHRIPVFSVDGRSRYDMNIVLMALLGKIEPRIVAEAINAASE